VLITSYDASPAGVTWPAGSLERATRGRLGRSPTPAVAHNYSDRGRPPRIWRASVCKTLVEHGTANTAKCAVSGSVTAVN
jgi:hypothetical protein